MIRISNYTRWELPEMWMKPVSSVILCLTVSMSSAAATGIPFSLLDTNDFAIADHETLRCMQCHDGVTAMDVEISFQATGSGMSGLHTGKHPVGMRYLNYVLSTPLEYRSQDSLNSTIELVDGQVSCVSCHRVKPKQNREMLSSSLAEYQVTNCISSRELNTGRDQTGLCRSCHIK